MKILYEDNHLIAVDKPAGLLTQPSGTDLPNLEDQVRDYLPTAFVEAVHRLDRVASGIVLFAKTKKALRRLQEVIRERKVQKNYITLVEGKPPKPEGELRHLLIHDHQRARVNPSGKEAILRYRTKKAHKGYTFLEIELITGRYHQIRAQLAAIGCPIVGDGKYGGTPVGEGIALHHHRFSFPHPTLGKEIVVTSEIDYTSPLWQS